MRRTIEGDLRGELEPVNPSLQSSPSVFRPGEDEKQYLKSTWDGRAGIVRELLVGRCLQGPTATFSDSSLSQVTSALALRVCMPTTPGIGVRWVPAGLPEHLGSLDTVGGCEG